MTRQRSASITPTYSTDLALLHIHNPTALVSTVDEAISALSSVDICNNAAFKRRANLETVEEWTALLQTCLDGNDNINLEIALKKCYALTYSMPPSPFSQSRQVDDPPSPLLV